MNAYLEAEKEMRPIAIIDYGMGNVRSVQKAIERIGGTAIITNSPLKIITAQAVILPGVGAFQDAIQQLKKLQIDTIIQRVIESGKPFLGICLGMQLLFSKSYEHGVFEGLKVIQGEVVKFPDTLKVPHIGWNTIQKTEMPLLQDIPDNSYFYFVHSYYVKPDDESVVSATTTYGLKFASMIGQGNVYGTQFHPEKSQTLGLNILKNFLKLII